MLEFVLILLMVLIACVYVRGHPFVKHFLNYQRERKELVKRHTRLYKTRNELMVSAACWAHFHLDAF